MSLEKVFELMSQDMPVRVMMTCTDVAEGETIQEEDVMS